MAAIGGALYVPQVGIINPGEFAPQNSIEAVIWVAVGGRGTLYGAILGAVLVNLAKTIFTGQLPELWLFALGGAVHIAVTLFLPRGLVGLVRAPRPTEPPVPADQRRSGLAAGQRRSGLAAGRRAARGWEPGMIGAASDTLLYLSGVSVSFDGFRALNNLALVLAPGEMRAVIGPNGAGKTTMMDVINRQDPARPGPGRIRRQHRPHQAGRGPHRLARHRAQVPEAHRVRTADRLGQPAAGAVRRPPPPGSPSPPGRPGRSGTASTRSSAPSGCASIATAGPGTSAMGRSSGSRSACCWRRTRGCCWWTSPSRG